MNDLGNQVYRLEMQNLITLWEIDFNPTITFDPAPTGIMYISAYRDGTSNITHLGQTYDYVGIKGSGFRSEINGTLPEPSLVIDKNSLNGIAQYQTIKSAYTSANQTVFFDWRGAKIKRTRITSNYINDPTKGDVDYYVVNQLTRTTKDTIEVGLSVSVGADRINNLSVQELAPNRCALRYRTHNGSGFDYVDEDAGGCPYGNPTTKHNWSNVTDFGTRYYTEQDGDTVNANQDRCSYTVGGCQKRFDPDLEGLQLPFLGLYSNSGSNE